MGPTSVIKISRGANRSCTKSRNASASSRQQVWANQYRFLVGNCGFLHMVKKRPYCRLSPPYLFYRDQVPLVVHMQNRLDIQHGSHRRRRRRNPASPFEIGEIVYGEPVTNLRFICSAKSRTSSMGAPANRFRPASRTNRPCPPEAARVSPCRSSDPGILLELSGAMAQASRVLDRPEEKHKRAHPSLPQMCFHPIGQFGHIGQLP